MPVQPDHESIIVCGIEFYRTNPYDGREQAVWAASEHGVHFTMTTARDGRVLLYRIEGSMASSKATGAGYRVTANSGYRVAPEDALKEVYEALQMAANATGKALTSLWTG